MKEFSASNARTSCRALPPLPQRAPSQGRQDRPRTPRYLVVVGTCEHGPRKALRPLLPLRDDGRGPRRAAAMLRAPAQLCALTLGCERRCRRSRALPPLPAPRVPHHGELPLLAVTDGAQRAAQGVALPPFCLQALWHRRAYKEIQTRKHVQHAL